MIQTRRVTEFAFDHSLLLLVGSVAGLLWANLNARTYEPFAHAIHFAVNEVGMAFFFALAVKEVVEATAPHGALHSRRHAGMPLLAATGGMVGPAAIYLLLVLVLGREEFLRGWAIPCATDIAFSYMVVRLIFGPRHPAIPFLLLLAIADDALGLAILAVFYPAGNVRLLEFIVLLGAAVAIALWLRRRVHHSFWPYLATAGLVSWIAFYRGGLHPALALVPVVPFLPDTQEGSEDGKRKNLLGAFEHFWKSPVQLVLLFFGLANAGVAISSTGPGTWMVLAAILLGKPIGILVFTTLGISLGLKRPAGVSWRDLTVVGTAAGIGFTVALFFATAAFPPGDLLDESKMGALLSFVAAPAATLVAAALGVGRWRGDRSSRRSGTTT